MLEHKRIVFTGGPSSGKTSVLNNIQLPHIHCFEEVSRELISEGQAKGINQPFLNNPLHFSEAIFELRLHDYFEDSKNKNHVLSIEAALNDLINPSKLNTSS